MASQVDRERIAAVIWEVDLTDLNSIIGQEVVPDVLEVIGLGEESQHLSIKVQELLLGGDSTATKRFLEVLKEFLIFLNWNWLLRVNKVVLRASLAIRLSLTKVLKSVTCF